jgi:hypothetical protein
MNEWMEQYTFAFAVSKIVSTNKTSAPPSSSPFACSVYASTSWSKAVKNKE